MKGHRWLAAAGLGLAGLALYLGLYFFPRLQEIRRLEDQVRQLRVARGEVAALLPEAARTAHIPPDPIPDVPGWLTQNALAGIEKHLDVNNPYRQGRGAQVKLRSLGAEQVAGFLTRLAGVNLILQRLEMEDRDGDGAWAMEVFVEVPGP